MGSELSEHIHDPTVIDHLLKRQQDGWRRGERIFVETLIEDNFTHEIGHKVLLELVWNEVDLRAALGETPRLEEYCQRFPTLSEDLRRQFDVFAVMGSLGQSVNPIVRVTKSTNREATALSALGPANAWHPGGFEILCELGRGGMGVVYKAWETDLDRVVALKMILSGAYADPEERDRFHAEAEVIARLQHPNIVQIHHIGEEEGKPFLVLEFVAGGSLDKRLGGTPLPGTEAALLVETLARAMHQAHQRGVVHRDLKPANVLLTESGTPKVTDFGLAKRLDVAGPSQSGDILGTPSYMAPEQAAGTLKEVGPATDVYALGAILYECLTGRPPFKAATLLDTLLGPENQQ